MPGKSQTKKILRPSGAYQIRCGTNGKIYIGSAVNMLARWAHHRRSLQRGIHKNQRLQQAWNKYGEESFEFTVVEYVTPAFLLRAVAHGRICSHRGWTHKNGRQKSEPKVYTGFINPDGQRVIITNLRAFCREHGLHPVHMHYLKNGQRKSHKGWTWRESNEQPDAS